MKTANVVSVIDRGPLDAANASGVAGSRVEQMSDLLRRYPSIDDTERQQLLRFLTKGAQEEIVLATHVPGLGPQLTRFRKDHRSQFRAGLAGWMPMILFFGIPMIGVAWRLLG